MADPTRVRLLELLWFQPRSAQELAAELDQPADRLYYHLARLEEAGLVTVASHRALPRGKVERIYKPTDDEPVDDEVAPEEHTQFLDALIEATRIDLLAARARRLTGKSEDGVSISRSTLRLAPERYRELVAEIDALVARFRADRGEGDLIPLRIFTALIPLEAR